jgi:hypothetical protein
MGWPVFSVSLPDPWHMQNDAWKMGGKACGVYTGFHPNLTMIGQVQRVDPTTCIMIGTYLGIGFTYIFRIMRD